MAGMNTNDGGEGRQERRRWRVRNALGLLSWPNRIVSSGDVRSGSAPGGGTLAALRMRRGALIPGILALAMMAALLASVIIVPSGLNGPPAAVAQGTVCGPAILTLSPLAEGLSVTFKYDSSEETMANPTGYRFRHALSGGNDWSGWDDFTVTSGVFIFNATSEWTASKTVYQLQPLTSYKVQAEARCSPTSTSSTATQKTVTTSKTRTVSITLTRNGAPITELLEGQAGTLTLTLDSSDVYVVDVGVSAEIIPSSEVFQGTALPQILQDDVSLGTGGAFERKTLGSRETTLSWTVTAVVDSVSHSTSLTDDEHPRESALIIISPASVANGAFEVSSSSWNGALRIRDNDPTNPVPFGNNPAQATLTVLDSSPLTGPEVPDTLTASLGLVTDADGAPAGGYVFEYAWLDDGVPIPGAVSTTYEVGVDDIGRTLTARVQFRDALNNLETLTNDLTATGLTNVVPRGPVIEVPTNGYVWDTDPQTDNTITVDTSTMNYSYLPDPPPEFTYVWIYVNEDGTSEGVATSGFNLDPEGFNIDSNAHQSYRLREANEGKYLQVEVSFRDADNILHTKLANERTPVITESTITPPPPPPTATATPEPSNPTTGTVIIDDTSPEVGETLTASVDDLQDLDLDPSLDPPASFFDKFTATLSHVWLRGDRPIDGATGSTYVVQGDDVGLTLSVRMMFKDLLDNDEMLTSDPTSVVPSGPVIQAPTGFFWDDDPTTANTISVDTSVMNYSYLPSGATFTYQWFYVDEDGTELRVYEDTNGMQFVNPTNIAPGYTRVYASGTTSSDEYELTLVDDDKYLQVRVSFTDTNSVLQTKLANIQTPLISEFTEPPGPDGNYQPRGTVTISNTTPEIRDSLTASRVNVSDRNGLISATYSYQWYNGGRLIPGAVGETYEVEVKDIGRTLSVQVQFTDDDGFSEMLTSEPAAVVPSGAEIALASGTTGYFYDDDPATDNTITVNTSAMTYSYLPANPTFTYQWIYVAEDGTPGGDASATDSTSQTYDLTSADHDKYLQVEVTFAGVTKLANTQTPQIGDEPPGPDGYKATGTVTISNATLINAEPEVGDILTASVEDVRDRDGLGSPSYRYQWYNGRSPIFGAGGIPAMGDTYQVTVDDIDFRLSAGVRFRDAKGNNETLRSEETEIVPSGPLISRTATGDYLWDSDPTTDDTISVVTFVIGYSYLPVGPTFTYQWIYVNEDGTKEGDAAGTPSTMQSYTLTSADDLKYLQVEVTFDDTRTNGTATRLANSATELIRERLPLKIPTGLTARPSSEDGSVRLSWDLTTQGENPSGFKYRYKPTVLLGNAPFTDSDWITARGGSSARSVTITGNLINNADYTFEVASYSPRVEERAATTDRATAVYRQKTRGC